MGYVVDHRSQRSVLPSSWVTSISTPSGNDVKVGVIGLAFPHTAGEPLSFTSTLDFLPLVEAANRLAAEMQAKGVETIVVSMHEGGRQDGSYNQCRNPDGPIFEAARQIFPAVDAILGGHWHTAFACSIPGPDGVPRPVIESSSRGRLLGEVRLAIDPGTGDVIPGLSMAMNHPVTKDIVPDSQVQDIVRYWEQRWDERRRTPIATIDRDLEFATDAESPMGNVAADLYREAAQQRPQGGADLALVPPDLGGNVVDSRLGYAPSSLQNDEPGRILFREAWFAMGISPIVNVTLTGTQIDAILEEQWQPQAYGCRRDASMSLSQNVRVTADLGRPVGDRIHAEDVVIDGRPLDPDRTYRVATTALLTVDGDTHGYPPFLEGDDPVRASQTGREAWLDYLRNDQGIDMPDVGRTTLVPGIPPPVDGPFGPLQLVPRSEFTATASSQGNMANRPASGVD